MGQQGSTEPKNDGPKCGTSIQVNLAQQVTVGSYTQTYLSSFGILLSYANNGMAMIAFLFPTVITVSYHFKYGRQQQVYKKSLEALLDRSKEPLSAAGIP